MLLWAIQNIPLALLRVSKLSVIFALNIILYCHDLWAWGSTSAEIFKTHLYQSLSNPSWTFTDPVLSTSWSPCHPNDCGAVISWVRQDPATALPAVFPYVLNKKRVKKSPKNSRAHCLVSFPCFPSPSIVIVPYCPVFWLALKKNLV